MFPLQQVLRLSGILIFSLSLFHGASGQGKFGVSGQLSDTAEKKQIWQASVILLRAADSVLQAAVRTDQAGRFKLPSVEKGNYILQVSYPKYADYISTLEVNRDIELGQIPIISAFYLLKEIVVKSPSSAIRIKGDTTEFIADSFKVTPNSDVQELLRRMPGFQINAKGEITAQGEKVQKILVDGEEFFSDDPAVVTKNLRADAVEKVQLFDKKSDQAAFTGIEDGERTKTINLQIKEDSKKGFFGKVEGLSNFNQYASGKLMANAFKGKRKAAGYVTTSNTQFEGLSWEEDRNYNGGGNSVTEMLEDGGMIIMSQGDEDYGDNKGLPQQQTVGGFYGDKWGRLSTSNSGQFQRLQTAVTGKNFTRSLLEGFSLDNTTTSNQQLDKKRYKFNTTNEWGTDSTGLFKVILKGRQVLKSAIADYEGQSLLNGLAILNTSKRSTSNQEEEKSGTANLSYRKKFAKKGRSFSLTADLDFTNTDQDGSIKAENTFYENGLPKRIESVDQQKDASQVKSVVNTAAVFTEPLSKKSFLVFRYGLLTGGNDAVRNTFSKDVSGAYKNVVDSLSNHFIFNSLNNNGSLSYRFVEKKINFVIGAGLGKVNYRTKDVETYKSNSVAFTNFLPTFAFTYKPRQQRNLNISYNGSPVNPTLQQIQPLIDNTDPLRLNIGNSELVQGFNNKINFRFTDFKVLKSRYVSLSGDFSNTRGAITGSNEVSADGKTVSKFVNVDGIFYYNVDFNYDMELFKGIHGGFSVGHNFNRYINFVNSAKNTNDNRSNNFSINLNYWGDRWYSFYASVNASQNKSISSIQSSNPTSYFSLNGYGSVSLKFKKIKTYIDLNVNANIYGKSDAFAKGQQVFLFNPTFKKVVTKNDALEVKVSVFDLFNQNADISRNISSNFISESVSNTIRRYVLVGLVYNFKNKSAVAVSK